MGKTTYAHLLECQICSSSFMGRLGTKFCSRTCLNRSEYTTKMLDSSWRLNKLLAAAKNRAKEKHLPFDLTLEHLVSLWENNNGKCEVTKYDFDLKPWGNKGQVNPKAPSVDRIVPEQGYVKGNVRLVTYHINVALSEFGLDAFKELCATVVSFR